MVLTKQLCLQDPAAARVRRLKMSSTGRTFESFIRHEALDQEFYMPQYWNFIWDSGAKY